MFHNIKMATLPCLACHLFLLQLPRSRIPSCALEEPLLLLALLSGRSPAMARTNVRAANDQRPLPRGIGSHPPRIIRRRRRPAPQPRAPTISPTPPPQRPSTLAERLAAVAEYRDQLVATRLSHICDDMPSYESRYRAAVIVRTHLGNATWELLEQQRRRIVRFACLMRKLDREHRPFWRASLDRSFAFLEAYVERACGKYMREFVFRMLHVTLESVIEEEAAMGMGVQTGLLMSTMRELFHRQPFLWFVYNLYFPVRGLMGEPGRMNWVQLKDWAIWTLENPREEPSWFSCWLEADEQVPLPAVSAGDLIWNAAMIEAFRDVGARFGP